MRHPCTVAECPELAACKGYCGRHYARWKRSGTTDLMEPANPGFGKGNPGGGLWWTKARIALALQTYAKAHRQLPTNDHIYNELKKGRLELPPAARILEVWHSMASAWLAVGVNPKRVPLTNSRWSSEDEDFLLEHAGEMSLNDIAARLHRSYAAVRTKLGAKGFGLKARQNQGWLSAAEVAKEYGAPYSRVCQMLADGTLPATYNAKGHRWHIDPMDAERLRDLLSAPKTQSYKSTPPDLGDYYDRYGIKRTLLDGRLVRVERSA